MTSGGRNLAILGVGAILLTVITTATSLALYRTSGDIYLDRSRPGYLPDEDEMKDDQPPTAPDYVFPESGNLDKAELEQYLVELQKLDQRLNEFPDPYSPTPLSDESLGIPSELPESSKEAE